MCWSNYGVLQNCGWEFIINGYKNLQFHHVLQVRNHLKPIPKNQNTSIELKMRHADNASDILVTQKIHGNFCNLISCRSVWKMSSIYSRTEISDDTSQSQTSTILPKQFSGIWIIRFFSKIDTRCTGTVSWMSSSQ